MTTGIPELLFAADERRAPLRAVTTAYRLVDDAADGFPGVTVDRYADWAVVSLYGAAAVERLGALSGALLDGFARGVYVKHRLRGDLRRRDRDDVAPTAPVAGLSAPADLAVEEYGMVVGVALDDGISTGLFTDQRDNRRLIRDVAGGARVLNLFSYSCSFSVSAALGGATETVSVDLSKRALERGRRNFTLNGVATEGHRFIAEDALKFVERACRRGERFDLVVLDPPSFGTSTRGTFSVERDYAELAQRTLALLRPAGRLLAVTNHRKTTAAKLRSIVADAARAADRTLAEIRDLPLPIDHSFRPGGCAATKSLLARLE